MKPIYQTRFGNNGNCHEACIASILEIPLKRLDVYYGIPDNPDIEDRKKFFTRRYKILDDKINQLGYDSIKLGYNCVKTRLSEIEALNFGLPEDLNDEISKEKYIDIIRDAEELKNNCYGGLPTAHCILSLKNPDSEYIGHAVVGKIENGKIVGVHDPYILDLNWFTAKRNKLLYISNPVLYDLDVYCCSLEFFVKI